MRRAPDILLTLLGTDGEKIATTLEALSRILSSGRDMDRVRIHICGPAPEATRKLLRQFKGQHLGESPPSSEGELIEILSPHHAIYYIVLEGGAVPHPHLIPVATASWEAIQDEHKGLLGLSGGRPRPTTMSADRVETSVPTIFQAKSFIVGKLGLGRLQDPEVQHYTTEHDMVSGGIRNEPNATTNRIQPPMARRQTIVRSRAVPESVLTPPVAREPLDLVAKKAASLVSPQPEPVHVSVTFGTVPTPIPKKAAFLIATHHRPALLRVCLQTLAIQTVPPGWTYEILVAGEPTDLGRWEAGDFDRTRFVSVASSLVTTKLNKLLQETDAELVILADDDDLQPQGRLAAAVSAFTGGFEWAGSRICHFYHVAQDCLTRWEGPRVGLIGTSLSFSTKLLREIQGWPELERGKDGPLVDRIQRLERRPIPADLTDDLAKTVCLQHGKNIWDRPLVDKGSSTSKGTFQIRGLGTWKEAGLVPSWAPLIQEIQATPPLSEPVPAPPRLKAPSQPMVTCEAGGPGQSALVEGLCAYGFVSVPFSGLRAHLEAGRPVLLHGWGRGYETLGKEFPGKVFVLWHSGWTGSDLLNEGTALQEALQASAAKCITLVWLSGQDEPPVGAIKIRPLWSMSKLRDTVTGVQKVPKRIVVGLNSSYPSAAKNVLASVVGCVGFGADIHIGQGSLEGSRGVAITTVLAGEKVTTHPFLNRVATLKLLASAQLLVHPSLTDTWPYLVLEAVHLGTPVILSDAVEWVGLLPDWAKDLCLVRPASSSTQIREKVVKLLAYPERCQKLVQTQRDVLDSLLPGFLAQTQAALQERGFGVFAQASTPVITESKEGTITQVSPNPKVFTAPKLGRGQKPRALLLADVRNWAFDINLRDMAEYLKDQFNFDFWYVGEQVPWPDSLENRYHVIYVSYLRWPNVNQRLDYSRAVGSLRTRWFIPERPGPPTKESFDLVNRFRGFHVTTQDALRELQKHCPSAIYLTNPVNMRRFLSPTPIRDKVVASWNGNAKHINVAGIDVKGFYNLVQPACEAAGVPLVYAEYHTKRVAPADMPAFYQQANLAVSVSIYEGASNSVMEAMASGHALITTDVGNHREMYESQLAHLGDTGIVLVERNLEAISKAIRKLKKDPKRVQEMGLLNRQEIQERWSWAVWASRYEQLLSKSL